jgi:hypothetical protein
MFEVKSVLPVLHEIQSQLRLSRSGRRSKSPQPTLLYGFRLHELLFPGRSGQPLSELSSLNAFKLVLNNKRSVRGQSFFRSFARRHMDDGIWWNDRKIKTTHLFPTDHAAFCLLLSKTHYSKSLVGIWHVDFGCDCALYVDLTNFLFLGVSERLLDLRVRPVW